MSRSGFASSALADVLPLCHSWVPGSLSLLLILMAFNRPPLPPLPPAAQSTSRPSSTVQSDSNSPDSRPSNDSIRTGATLVSLRSEAQARVSTLTRERRSQLLGRHQPHRLDSSLASLPSVPPLSTVLGITQPASGDRRSITESFIAAVRSPILAPSAADAEALAQILGHAKSTLSAATVVAGRPTSAKEKSKVEGVSGRSKGLTWFSSTADASTARESRSVAGELKSGFAPPFPAAALDDQSQDIVAMTSSERWGRLGRIAQKPVEAVRGIRRAEGKQGAKSSRKGAGSEDQCAILPISYPHLVEGPLEVSQRLAQQQAEERRSVERKSRADVIAG